MTDPGSGSKVHIITRKTLVEDAGAYPGAASSLDAWYRIAKAAAWTNLNEVRAVFPHADQVGTCVVFNISGNKFCLIVNIAYVDRPKTGEPRFGGKIYILTVLNHSEYDTGKWKSACDC